MRRKSVSDRICSKCRDLRNVKQCNSCRRNDFALSKKRYVGKCITCELIKPLASSGECRKCYRKRDIKACTKCKELKVAPYSFDKNRPDCRECRKKLR